MIAGLNEELIKKLKVVQEWDLTQQEHEFMDKLKAARDEGLNAQIDTMRQETLTVHDRKASGHACCITVQIVNFELTELTALFLLCQFIMSWLYSGRHS